MEALKLLLEESREPLAILGMLVLALIHPSETTNAAVLGALAGIITMKRNS